MKGYLILGKVKVSISVSQCRKQETQNGASGGINGLTWTLNDGLYVGDVGLVQNNTNTFRGLRDQLCHLLGHPADDLRRKIFHILQKCLVLRAIEISTGTEARKR